MKTPQPIYDNMWDAEVYERWMISEGCEDWRNMRCWSQSISDGVKVRKIWSRGVIESCDKSH